MNKRNKRVQQSISMISDAFITLLNNKPYAEITISEICQTATVSRNTFYRIFDSKEEVLTSILKEKTGYIIGQFHMLENYDLNNPSESDIVRSYDRYYRYWAGQKKLLDTLYRQDLLWLLDRAFLETLPDYGSESFDKIVIPQDPAGFEDYYYFWHSMSMSKILQKWIMRGFRESLDELIAITIRLYQTMNFKWS